MGNKLTTCAGSKQQGLKALAEDKLPTMMPENIIVYQHRTQSASTLTRSTTPTRANTVKKKHLSEKLSINSSSDSEIENEKQKKRERRYTRSHKDSILVQSSDPTPQQQIRINPIANTKAENKHSSYAKSLRQQHHHIIAGDEAKPKRKSTQKPSRLSKSKLSLRSSKSEPQSKPLTQTPSQPEPPPVPASDPDSSQFTISEHVYDHLPPSPKPGTLRVVNTTPRPEKQEAVQRTSTREPISSENPQVDAEQRKRTKSLYIDKITQKKHLTQIEIVKHENKIQQRFRPISQQVPVTNPEYSPSKVLSKHESLLPKQSTVPKVTLPEMRNQVETVKHESETQQRSRPTSFQQASVINPEYQPPPKVLSKHVSLLPPKESIVSEITLTESGAQVETSKREKKIQQQFRPASYQQAPATKVPPLKVSSKHESLLPTKMEAHVKITVTQSEDVPALQSTGSQENMLHPEPVGKSEYQSEEDESLDNKSPTSSTNCTSDTPEFSDEEDSRTICDFCKLNGNKEFCERCEEKKVRDSTALWTSDNYTIDSFIRGIQLSANSRFGYVEWVNFDRLKDVKFVTRGGFSSIYYGTWLDWPSRDGPRKVALKLLHNSRNIHGRYLNELRIYFKTVAESTNVNVIHCYGITRDPATSDFMILLDYAEIGDLHQCFRRNFTRLSWPQKICMLYDIIKGLKSIHSAGLLHRDLHTTNILIYNVGNLAYSAISDIGLTGPAYKPRDNTREIYGVLPYVAPEVLCGGEYTKLADIYSFAMVVWEFTSGRRPFSDVAHDQNLAISIYNGRRPKIVEGTPKCLVWLMERCWSADLTKRLDAATLHEILGDWVLKVTEGRLASDDIAIEFQEAEEYRLKEVNQNDGPRSSRKGKHPQAIYRSQLMDFSTLRESVASDEEQVNSAYFVGY